jgi:hypothetical protein
MSIQPAPVGNGIIFHGSSDETFNTAAANGASVRAHYSAVQPSALCTTLASERLRVSTVEHLLAALSACRISNADVFVHNLPPPSADAAPMAAEVRYKCADRKMLLTPPPRYPSWTAAAPPSSTASSGPGLPRRRHRPRSCR